MWLRLGRFVFSISLVICLPTCAPTKLESASARVGALSAKPIGHEGRRSEASFANAQGADVGKSTPTATLFDIEASTAGEFGAEVRTVTLVLHDGIQQLERMEVHADRDAPPSCTAADPERIVSGRKLTAGKVVLYRGDGSYEPHFRVCAYHPGENRATSTIVHLAEYQLPRISMQRTGYSCDVELTAQRSVTLSAQIGSVGLHMVPSAEFTERRCDREPLRRLSAEQLEASDGLETPDDERMGGTVVEHVSLDCGEYVGWACAEIRQGRPQPGYEYRFDATGESEQVIETDSGPLQLGLLRAGDEVVARDVASGRDVLASVIRAPKARRGRWVVIELGTDGRCDEPKDDGNHHEPRRIGRLYVPDGTELWVASEGSFVPAAKLQVGATLLRHRGQLETVVEVWSSPEPWAAYLAIDWPDVGWPNTFYFSEFLVKDPKHTKPGREEPRQPSRREPADVVFQPTSESYDCRLFGHLLVQRLPPDTRAVGVAVAPHTGPMGRREWLSCTSNTLHVLFPVEVFRDALRKHGKLEFATDLGGGVVDCNKPLAVAACVEGPDGFQALEPARSAFAGPPCLAEGTLIETPHGPTPIERVPAGSLVVSFDHETRQRVVARVSHVRYHEASVRALKLSDGTLLEATDEHLLWSELAHDYVRADQLAEGARLHTIDGFPLTVVAVTPNYRTTTVYDLTVSGPQNYFAGGVLVHNY